MDTELEKIKNISKEVFKKQVKEKITKAALAYLLKISEKHSKMENLQYDNLSMQNYFKSKVINKIESQKLFKLRTNMKDFKTNFKNGNEKLACLVYEETDQPDSQNHFLKCSVMNTEIPELLRNNIEDIYSKEEETQKKIINVLLKALKKELLLSKSNP